MYLCILYTPFIERETNTHIHVQKLGRISRWIYFTKIQEEINTVTKLGKTHIQKKCFFSGRTTKVRVPTPPPPQELSGS